MRQVIEYIIYIYVSISHSRVKSSN